MRLPREAGPGLEGGKAEFQVRLARCEVSLLSVLPLFVRNLFLLSRPFIPTFFVIDSFCRDWARVFFRFFSFTLQYSVA